MAEQYLQLSGTDVGPVMPSGAEGPSAIVAYDVHVYHELGAQTEAQTVQETVEIDPSPLPSTVHIKSHIIASGTKALKSPQYLATIRRRHTRTIAALIRKLAAHADDQEFPVWTQEPLDRLRRLIQTLSDAEQYSTPEHEGNSCEILRQLRDTFLNIGWKRYREPQVRSVACRILDRLATVDEVSGEDASWSMDQLLDVNLDPAVGFMWHHGKEEIPG